MSDNTSTNTPQDFKEINEIKSEIRKISDELRRSVFDKQSMIHALFRTLSYSEQQMLEKLTQLEELSKTTQMKEAKVLLLCNKLVLKYKESSSVELKQTA